MNLYSNFSVASFSRTTSLSHSSRLAAHKITAHTAMGKTDQDNKQKMNTMEEREGNVASDNVQTNSVVDRIIPHILNLYGSCATSHDFEIYAPDASFEDPLSHAKGVKQIKSAFYSIPKVFRESKIVEYSVQENDISPSKKEILIDNKQHYNIFGKNIDMISLIKLYVEDGKIIRHEDWWDKKPLANRNTVKLPLGGRFFEMARRGSMLTIHAMMCFGKDPDPKNHS